MMRLAWKKKSDLDLDLLNVLPLPFCTLILGETVSKRMIDDKVGLKEKPENTSYIKRLHQNETRSTGIVGKTKHNGIDFNFMPLFGIALRFGLCECFMTTFLHTHHSWLNWVDEAA